MPKNVNHNGAFSLPNVGKGIAACRTFNDGNAAVWPERNLFITGVTKDSTGAALGNVALLLFDKAEPDVSLGPFYSDAAGNYSIPIPVGFSQAQVTTWKIDAYKAGAPDVAGTTANTLVGV